MTLEKNIKIACIMTDWATSEYKKKHNRYGGIGYYRIVKPYTELRKLGYHVDIYNRELHDMAEGKNYLEFMNLFVQDYDIIITKAIDDPNAGAQLAFLCQHNGVKLIIDLDDNYFEVKPDQPAYKWYYPGSKHRAYFAAYLSQASAVITSTEPLQKYYRNHLKEGLDTDMPIFVMPNFNDVKDWPKPVARNKDKVVIGWAGSTTHDADLQLILPALNRLMNENDNVYFEMTGGVTMESAPKLMSYFEDKALDKVKITGGTQSWIGYPELLMKKKWDIGIAPLVNDNFTKGKSHIKWIEYAMAKIPCVASKVYPYYQKIGELDTIIDGETGFLAIDGLDFYKKLKILVEDKELRAKIGENAYNSIKENWQWENNIDKLDQIIQQIWQT